MITAIEKAKDQLKEAQKEAAIAEATLVLVCAVVQRGFARVPFPGRADITISAHESQFHVGRLGREQVETNLYATCRRLAFESFNAPTILIDGGTPNG